LSRERRLDKSPAYQWYPRDFLSDALVAAMTLEQEGCYRRLLDVAWLEGGLPGDPDLLWRLAKAPSRAYFERKLWPIISRKFRYKTVQVRTCGKVIRTGTWSNPRLERERAKQKNLSSVRQLAAEWRWHKEHARCNANASCLQCSAFALSIANIKSSTSTGRAPRAGLWKTPKPEKPKTPDPSTPDPELGPNEGTFALYCVIALEASDQARADGDQTTGAAVEWFKTLCARRSLDYDAGLATRALAAIHHNRRARLQALR